MFALALAWSLAVVRVTLPIGASEEHFAIGQRLYRTGSLAGENDPGVLRPPGYPAFVAAALHLRDALVAMRGLDATRVGAAEAADEDAVLLGHCLLAAATATVTFAFAATRLGLFEAACAGLVLACGPLTVALLGLRSYQLLHVLSAAAATAQLAFAASAPGRSSLHVVWAGTLWGIATLVRPVTLILPPFVFLLARVRRGGAWRPAAVFTLLFTAGMAIPILPYAARNYSITGRFVPVNVQGGFALWATTAARPRDGEGFLSWPQVWNEYGMTLYRNVTGDPEYDLATFSTHVVELEDAFRRQALRNLRRSPSVYLGNVANNLWRFASDPMASWPRTFSDQNQLAAARTRSLVGAWSGGLLLLALPGLVLGLVRRDASAWTLLLVFAAIATAHAVTFLNARYTYVKLPLLAMASTLTILALADRSTTLGRSRVQVRLAAVLAAILLVVSAWATLVLLAR